MKRNLIDMRATAAKLNRTYDWFSRNRKTLQRDHGFPTPVPGMGNLYDPAAIDRWLDGFIDMRDRHDGPAAGDAVDIGLELADRAQAIAGRLGDD